jgi:hypothetical protein
VLGQVRAVDLNDAFCVMPTPGNITGAQRVGGSHHDVGAATSIPARPQAGAEDLESILPAGGVVQHTPMQLSIRDEPESVLVKDLRQRMPLQGPDVPSVRSAGVPDGHELEAVLGIVLHNGLDVSK